MTDVNVGAARDNRELVIKRIFDAPPDLVFKAWTTPQHLVHWFGPKGFTAPTCEVDFRVGGSYRICMRSPEGVDHWVVGEYLEIQEPERLVFSWKREDGAGKIWSSTIVEATFVAVGDQTAFTLIQGMFETAPFCERHGFGWGQSLDRLRDYVEQLSK